METLEKILNLIAGKKATIFSIAQSLIVYLVAINAISNEMAVLLTSIITALAGGANYAGYKLGNKNK